MNKVDFKEIFDNYRFFLVFLFKPREILSFVKKNRGWKFLLSIFFYFTINTIVFVSLISYLNTKQLVTKWIPLVITIQCTIYIPLFLVSLRNLNSIEQLFIIIKIAIVETFVVYSTLLYFGNVFFFLFLATELYLFYYIYLAYSLLLIIYICIILSLKISDRKEIVLIPLVFICSLGTNYSSLLVFSELNNENKTVLLDIIYQESIEKTGDIIKFADYYIDHQKLICDLEQKCLCEGDKDMFEKLNKQIDLILQKKKDILEFNQTIKFDRNKKELLILSEIIEAYEKIKRELNAYEYISENLDEDVARISNELKQLSLKLEHFENEISNSYEKEKYETELLEMNNKIEIIQQFFEDSLQSQIQLKINIESVEEINANQEFINMKVFELTNQIRKTQEYWKRREKILF